jgi:spore coat protein CotF
MSKNSESPLVASVKQLDADVKRFEELSRDLARLQINSEKSLQRARQTLEECSAHETKLAGSLRAFAEAAQTMQQLQSACMQEIAQSTKRIAERHAERLELQQRLVAIGESARAASAPFTELHAPESRPSAEGEQSPSPVPDGSLSDQLLEPLGEVERRLEAVIEEASALCELTHQGDWNDLERDTQSLREQLQALRNRVLLTRRKLLSDKPS